jgi:hypothetical protein
MIVAHSRAYTTPSGALLGKIEIAAQREPAEAALRVLSQNTRSVMCDGVGAVDQPIRKGASDHSPLGDQGGGTQSRKLANSVVGDSHLTAMPPFAIAMAAVGGGPRYCPFEQ